MNVADFDYELPEELIAQYPLAERTASRLMCVNRESGAVSHQKFTDLIDHLNPGDLLIFNESRVIKARLFGQKGSGGKVEVLVERVISDTEVLAHVRSSKSPRVGTRIRLADAFEVDVTERKDALFRLCLTQDKKDWIPRSSRGMTADELEMPAGSNPSWFSLLDQHGHMPLPPYMHREDEDSDIERYQTVYSETEGSVAAPTAGLHFDQAFLDQIEAKGVEFGHVTLHVGAGTFQPVRVDNIEDHHMHSEWINVSSELVDRINRVKESGRKVYAVGTTTVRSLESAALSGELKPYQGETDIFIFPGYEFKVIDGMLTNFHLPKSTLLMLVSAFVGKDEMLNAYREAVHEKYRFFSYGDAMWLG